MDDSQKRRFFHKKPVRVDSLHAYDFIFTQKGVWSFFDKKVGSTAGKNMLFLLNFFLSRCSAETKTSKSTTKRDIAQTHWHSQKTIADDIGFDSADTVRQGVKALVSAGILIQEEKSYLRSGSGNFIAFSEKFIQACVYFCAQREREVERDCVRLSLNECVFKDLVKPVRCFFASPDGRNWLPRRLQLAPQTVAVGSPDGPKFPYIEESSKGIVKQNPKMNEEGPASDSSIEAMPEEYKKLASIHPVARVVKLSRKVEQLCWTDKYGTPTYDDTNLFVAEKVDSQGLRQVWEWIQWLPSLMKGKQWRKGMEWQEQMESAWDAWEIYQAEQSRGHWTDNTEMGSLDCVAMPH